MEFEYNPEKSAINAKKHGIDFEQAQKLWDDPDLIRLRSLQALDEERWLLIGRIGEKHYTAIITYRGEKTRIISVRRSREKEKKLYESQRAR
jgi:uncharacterized DUF497 family protein